MNRLLLYSILCLALVGCPTDPVDDDDDSAEEDPYRDIEELTFGAFEEWARPTADFIEINEEELGHSDFLHGIFDLAAFEDRLYIGYGDANLNLGRITPIELRYWDTLEPDAVVSEFATDEEQVDRFRLGDGMLIIPGVDATEDDLLGNVYTKRPGSDWYKSRTVEFAWHVHDAVAQGDTLWACGSGGTIEDYENSEVNAFLYRSDDGGQNFVIDQQVPHPAPPGDQRFTSLLALDDELYVFGYISNTQSITAFHNRRYAGGDLDEVEELDQVWVTDTIPLDGDAGLLMGPDLGFMGGWAFFHATADDVDEVDALADYTPVDSWPLGDGRVLLAVVEGDEYPTGAGPWELHVLLTTDGEDAQIILSQTLDIWPNTVALWRESLWLGMDDGSVWRAEGS